MMGAATEPSYGWIGRALLLVRNTRSHPTTKHTPLCHASGHDDNGKIFVYHHAQARTGSFLPVVATLWPSSVCTSEEHLEACNCVMPQGGKLASLGWVPVLPIPRSGPGSTTRWRAMGPPSIPPITSGNKGILSPSIYVQLLPRQGLDVYHSPLLRWHTCKLTLQRSFSGSSGKRGRHSSVACSSELPWLLVGLGTRISKVAALKWLRFEWRNSPSPCWIIIK